MDRRREVLLLVLVLVLSFVLSFEAAAKDLLPVSTQEGCSEQEILYRRLKASMGEPLPERNGIHCRPESVNSDVAYRIRLIPKKPVRKTFVAKVPRS